MSEEVEIRCLVSCAGPDFSLKRGEVKVMSKDAAESLIRAGYAEPVTARSKAATSTVEKPKEKRTTKTKK